MDFCLNICLYIICVLGVHRGLKKVMAPQELEPQVADSCYNSAVNHT